MANAVKCPKRFMWLRVNGAGLSELADTGPLWAIILNSSLTVN